MNDLIIFTDLDGTLLDKDTYSWEEAMPALDLCKGSGIPVIIVSSKTRAEIEEIHKSLSLDSPFISENGGGIFFPLNKNDLPLPSEIYIGNGLAVWPLGLPYDRLVNAFNEIRNETGLPLKGFSDMDLNEISRLTGLDLREAELAARREFDEPFIVEKDENILASNRGFAANGTKRDSLVSDIERLFDAAMKRGLNVVEGGRFYHLNKNDKGDAVRRLIEWYRHINNNIITVALGDSPNDFPMLRVVDWPILIGSKWMSNDLSKELPGLTVTEEGPKGWNNSILGILKKRGITT